MLHQHSTTDNVHGHEIEHSDMYCVSSKRRTTERLRDVCVCVRERIFNIDNIIK